MNPNTPPPTPPYLLQVPFFFHLLRDQIKFILFPPLNAISLFFLVWARDGSCRSDLWLKKAAAFCSRHLERWRSHKICYFCTFTCLVYISLWELLCEVSCYCRPLSDTQSVTSTLQFHSNTVYWGDKEASPGEWRTRTSSRGMCSGTRRTSSHRWWLPHSR